MTARVFKAPPWPVPTPAPAFVRRDEKGPRLRHCRNLGVEMFFEHVTVRDVAAARAVCRGCPALDDCRAYALPNSTVRGFWAGMTERERIAERIRLRRLEVAA